MNGNDPIYPVMESGAPIHHGLTLRAHVALLLLCSACTGPTYGASEIDDAFASADLFISKIDEVAPAEAASVPPQDPTNPEDLPDTDVPPASDPVADVPPFTDPAPATEPPADEPEPVTDPAPVEDPAPATEPVAETTPEDPNERKDAETGSDPNAAAVSTATPPDEASQNGNTAAEDAPPSDPSVTS